MARGAGVILGWQENLQGQLSPCPQLFHWRLRVAKKADFSSVWEKGMSRRPRQLSKISHSDSRLPVTHCVRAHGGIAM